MRVVGVMSDSVSYIIDSLSQKFYNTGPLLCICMPLLTTLFLLTLYSLFVQQLTEYALIHSTYIIALILSGNLLSATTKNNYYYTDL